VSKAGYVRRFSPVERLLHWLHALGFFFLLATGLILYLPSLSVLVARRLINPATGHALRGITLGDVRVEWAARHHTKWQAEGVLVESRTRHEPDWKPQYVDADRSRR